jgi:radical SAM superfamily enzyme YgiQ (UPF0313 family)
MTKVTLQKRLHVILIKPSKYDDDGYVIRWWRAVVTSNSLACVNALIDDVRDRKLLGPDLEIITHVFDETVQKIPVQKLARRVRKAGDRAIVCLVGVQSNQFPRAVDLAREFKKEGIRSMIGGFHVSGCVEMIPELTPEIKEAMEEGITLVAGETELRWAELLKAACEDRLEPLYNFLGDKPKLEGVPGPLLSRRNLKHFINAQTSFDAGRGCPFHCSFCTIINVQGNTMRGRSSADIERLVRLNHAQGLNHIFITDDNFARHPNWEKIADRMIDLKEREGLRSSLKIQTDTMAHKIPRFIEKLTRAGCRRVFIGLESVNPDNLRASGKYQNQLSEYRKMLQAWRDHGALTYAGYIIGFPGDTYESILRDVEYLKREIPLDFAEFFLWTPLPGSKDHQKYYREGVPMARDMNLYDTTHPCMEHPRMSAEELARAYRDAWESFYGKEHVLTLLKRRKGPRRRILFHSLIWFRSTMLLENIHPLLGGYFRLKGRKTRRPGYPIEPFLSYYWRRTKEILTYGWKMLWLFLETWQLAQEASRAENADYLDAAITPEPATKRGPVSSPVPVREFVASA